jgi:murein L,D-transpeptidase YafK
MSGAKRKVAAFAAAISILAGITSFVLVTSRMQDNQSMTRNGTRAARLSDPRIVIKKRERILELYDSDKLVKTYSVGLGFAPEGDKEKQGDGKTPEGDFYIFVKNPKSKFHLSLGLSYPSKEDAERGLAGGMISKSQRDQIVKAINTGKMPLQQTALGGEIYIHGGGAERDWTWGCIALSDRDVEEIYNAVEVGAKTTIRP